MLLVCNGCLQPNCWASMGQHHRPGHGGGNGTGTGAALLFTTSHAAPLLFKAPCHLNPACSRSVGKGDSVIQMPWTGSGSQWIQR